MEEKLDLTGGGQSKGGDLGGVSMDDFNPGLILYILNKSIVWIILTVAVCVTLSFLYLRYTPKIYESSVKLSLKAEKSTQILGITSLVFEKDQTEITREMQVLKSPIMLGTVCDSLGLKVGYFKEGKSKFIADEIYKSSPFRVEGDIKDYKINNIPIYIKIINTSKFLISFNVDGEDYEREFKFGDFISNKFFDVTVKTAGQPITKSEINAIYYFKLYEKSFLVNSIISKISLTPIDNRNKTLVIFCQDQSPEKARDILKLLAKEFIAFDVKKKRESIDNIVAFIDAQMDSFGRIQESMQDSISRFKISNEMFGDAGSYDNMVQTMFKLQTDIFASENRLLSMNGFKETIQTTKDYGSLPYIKFSDTDINAESDISRINNLKARRENFLLDVTEDHPKVRALDRDINEAKNQLLKRTENAIQNANRQLEKQKEKYQQVLAKVYSLPELQEQLKRLTRLADARNKLFYSLFDQKSKYAIAAAGIVPDYMLLANPSTPSTPKSPDETQIKLGGLVVGLLLGLLIVIIRFMMHKTIVSIGEIASKTPVPVLGVIPSYNTPMERSQVVVTKNPKSTITEAFRAIRSNLQFINNLEGTKILASTSTIPGEGKTFTAINIAAIISMLDKKVIIIDCDMRKPRLGKIFGIDSGKGLSTILSKQSGIDESIFPTEVRNIDVITSGPVPPNPSELLLNEAMDELIAELKTRYDFIVIDTPPVGLVTDALGLLSKADYPIYVLRAAYSNKSFIDNLNKLYNENNIRNLSAVLNDFGRGPSAYNYGGGYGYSYGYSYGYGYGYGVYGSYGFKTGYYSDDSSSKPAKKESLFSKIIKALKP